MNRSTRIVLAVTALLVTVAGMLILFFIHSAEPEPVPTPSTDVTPAVEEAPYDDRDTIGYSVEGRVIDVYTFGRGDAHVLLVGGIHGGYEWNSVLLAYEMIDYLAAERDRVPTGMTVSIIPALNPDGLFEVIGRTGRFTTNDVPADVGPPPTGRFNARGVDLNRNFDCKWQATSTWRSQPVSAGSAPFSEPEAAALRDYVLETMPDAVIFWHSKANAVYASECEAGILPGTLTLMETYASAARYPSVESFDHYVVTGDAEGWLASIGIPAVTVELETRTSTEWERNLAGTRAVIEAYAP